jgi:hypothetical protein
LLSELLELLEDGTLRIPNFQRAFKWQDEDRRVLFDSIARGFPIGTLLLWNRPATEPARTFGDDIKPLGSHPRAGRDALLVLDGQQRLWSLALSLHGRESAEGRASIAFDPKTDELVVVRQRGGQRDGLFPVSAARSSLTFNDWLGANPPAATDLEGIRSFFDAVQRTRILAYILDTADERVARRLFQRVNDSGRRLSEIEVFDALHANADASAKPASVGALTQQLQDMRFGPVKSDVVLQVLLAIQGHPDPTDGKKMLGAKLGVGELTHLLPPTQHALEQAITFLREDAGILHERYLPHTTVLLTLGLFFYRFPESTERTRELLTRWIYRGALNGSHARGKPIIREGIRAVRLAADEHDSVQMLLRSVGDTSLRVADVRASPRILEKLTLLTMLAAEPRDLVTGEPEDLAQLVQIPRQPVVIEKKDANDVESPDFGGAFFQMKAAKKIRSALTAEGTTDEVLHSHLLDRDWLSLIAKSDTSWVALRTERIRKARDAFLTRMAGIGADDGPPPEAFLIDDGEDP